MELRNRGRSGTRASAPNAEAPTDKASPTNATTFDEYCFRARYPVVVTSCLGWAAINAVLTFAVPAIPPETYLTLRPSTVGAAVCLVLAAARVGLHRTGNRVHDAAACFGWGWCALWSLSGLVMWLAQRHYELVGGMSAREWVCGPVALTGLFALLQRFIGLPTAPRLLTLAATGLMNLTTAHFTVLGRPHEGLLIVVALLAGDALGRPFELRRRAAYAREMAAGRALDASPDAAVHPVSLRFSDHALERAYAARCFKESYHMALPTGLGISAISFVLLAFAVPQTAPVGGAYVAPAVVALAFRVFQRGAADQARAHAQFEWLLAASVVVAASIVAVAQRQYVLVSGVPVERFAFVAATHTFCAFALRATVAPSAGPRLIIFAAVSLSRAAFSPSASDFGQPKETLLVVGALIVGELLSHPFELNRRSKFAREALASGRVADPDADAAALRLVNPLTLRFSDGGLERAYTARAFIESYSVVVAFCLVFPMLIGMVIAALGGTGRVAISLAVVFLALIGFRAGLHQATDQVNAASRFAWAWCALLTLMCAGTWAAQRRFVLIRGLTSRQWLCVAALYALLAIFQRVLTLPAMPRLLLLAVCGIMRLGIAPPMSVLGWPGEGVLLAAALALGEVLGHPFELRHRTAFAREALAAGRVPGPAVDAAALRLVHPLTLRFSNGDLERTYAARAFGESYSAVVAFCLALTTLLGLMAVASPATLVVHMMGASLILTLLTVRVWLHRAADQARAASHFAWCWCTLFTLSWIGIWAAQRRFGILTDMASQEAVALFALLALHQRFIGLPSGPRFLLLGAIVLAHLSFTPSMSELWQPKERAKERLFVAAAVFVGELIGHPFELRHRTAFAREAPGRTPDPVTDATAIRIVHPLTLRFSDQRLERAYGARTFGESYSTVLAFCFGIAALVTMLGLAVPPFWTVSLIHASVALGCAFARIGLHHAYNQAQARTFFTYCWCAMWAIAWAALVLLQKLGPTVSLTRWEVSCLAAIYCLGGLGQRFMILPAGARWPALASFVAGHRMVGGLSELGQPHETLLVAGSLLVGELLGHPFELQRVTAFARDVTGAGGARGTQTVEDATAVCHPLSLRFSDDEYEHAWAARSFDESYPAAVAFCGGMAVLLSVFHSTPVSTCTGVGHPVAAVLTLLLGVRAWVQGLPDKMWARDYFALAWSMSWCGLWSFLALHGGGDAADHCGDWEAAIYLGVFSVLLALFQRFIAFPLVPRLISLAGFAGAVQQAIRAAAPEGHTMLAIAAAILVGELIGHPFELRQRLAFAQTRAHEQLLAASEDRATARVKQLERDLMACISHEVRNPLNGTIGQIRLALLRVKDMLAKPSLPTQVRTQLELLNSEFRAVESTTMFAVTVLQSMTSLHKLEAGLLQPILRLEHLPDAMDLARTIVEPQLNPGVAMIAHRDEALSANMFECDRTWLSGMLINLLQNAARFTTSGFVELHVSVVGAAGDIAEVEFVVRDSGKGISKSETSSLFSRYASSGGVGLGLYLVKLQVQQMGGDIVVRSPWTQKHSGAEFRFALKLRQAARSELEDSSAKPANGSCTADDSGITPSSDCAAADDGVADMLQTPSLRMLIADDSALNRAVMRRSFAHAWPGWQIDEAAHGERAVEMGTQTAYDFVVMDLHFGPRCMDGATAVQRLRAIEAQQSRAPAVMVACTGNTASEETGRLRAAGVSAIWCKPLPSVTDGSLQRAVGALLAARAAGDN